MPLEETSNLKSFTEKLPVKRGSGVASRSDHSDTQRTPLLGLATDRFPSQLLQYSEPVPGPRMDSTLHTVHFSPPSPCFDVLL